MFNTKRESKMTREFFKHIEGIDYTDLKTVLKEMAEEHCVFKTFIDKKEDKEEGVK